MTTRKLTDMEFAKYVVSAYGFLVGKEKKIDGKSFASLITCCYNSEHARQCADTARKSIVWISNSYKDGVTASIRTN